MRSLALAVLSASLLGACATLGRPGPGERGRLWEQAHDAYARDSLRVAAAAFQRLVTDHPRSREAHESRFYLGVLALEPASGLDLGMAVEHLSVYLAEDSLAGFRSYHQREAKSLLRLVRQLARPCPERTHPALRCDPVVAGRTGEQPPPADGGGGDAARLRRELAERDETIRRLRDELERIRNTLAPRRTPP